MEMTYTKAGDYLIPDIRLSSEETKSIEMLPQMAMQAGVTEELKKKEPMAWAGMMNNLKAQAEEIILNELVFN